MGERNCMSKSSGLNWRVCGVVGGKCWGVGGRLGVFGIFFSDFLTAPLLGNSLVVVIRGVSRKKIVSLVIVGVCR